MLAFARCDSGQCRTSDMGNVALLTAAVLLCSLDNNQLCGLYKDNYGRIQGTYTTEGIVALSEGIKQCDTLVSLR